jgi:carbamoyl-phosphate synthase large subunit
MTRARAQDSIAPMKRLLLLSGGSRVGQNVLATVAERRRGLVLVATSSIADEPALFDFDAVHLVPPTASDAHAFEQLVLDIVDAERIDLVVPCRDDDVLFLADLRDRRPDLARRLLCGNRATAEVIGDKWLAYRFCAARGLPFVPTLHGGDAEERSAFLRENPLPCVAKPRRGFASRGVRMLWTEHQLLRALSSEGCVVQRHIGDAGAIHRFLADMDANGLPLFHTFQSFKHSIQVLVAPDGEVAHVICTRNQLDLRRAKRVEADPEPRSRRLGEDCGRALSAAGWRGPLNIQCQRDADGALLIHELNGRFTGATAVRWRLGFDEVGATIRAFTGQALDHAPGPPADVAHEGLASRAADPRDVAALARDRVWRAANEARTGRSR